MADLLSVKVVQVCKVSPFPPYSSPDSLPLTFFDLLWLRFPPVQRLYFYPFSPQPSISIFETIIPKLKHSLSLTLRHFLPLAGNLTWPQSSPKPSLKFLDGDGIFLTVAESDTVFYHLSDTKLRDAVECHSLIPHLQNSDESAAAVALQVTVFRSGFCIGITSHHAVLDGRSSTSFVKSWAQICKDGEDHNDDLIMKPFYDRSVIKDPDGWDAIFVNEWQNQNGPNNRSLKICELKSDLSDSVRGTFRLTISNIEKLKQFIKTKQENEPNGPVQISTFTVTSAYTWVCLAKAESSTDNKTYIVITFDARLRLDPKVPEKYLGNCVGGTIAIAERNELTGKDGFFVGVKAISEAIKRVDSEGVLGSVGNWISIMNSVMTAQKKEEKPVAMAGSPRFGVYAADFGWGRPRKVEMVSIDRTGAVCLSDSGNSDGGVEIGLVLRRHEMEAFAGFFHTVLEGL